MKVSCICPTYNRHERHQNLYAAFLQQSHGDRELLLLDDSESPSPFFSSLSDPRVKYIYTSSRHSVGVKRNSLVDMATGGIIAHFDDDDYYAPDYLKTMSALLEEADLVKLSKWLTWRESDGTLWEWDTAVLDKTSFWVKATGDVRPLDECDTFTPDDVLQYIQASLWGFGFSYVYRKSLWQAVPFADMNFGEDYCFVRGCQKRKMIAKHARDLMHLVLHTLHSDSSSIILPQVRRPASYALELFGERVKPWLIRYR